MRWKRVLRRGTKHIELLQQPAEMPVDWQLARMPYCVLAGRQCCRRVVDGAVRVSVVDGEHATPGLDGQWCAREVREVSRSEVEVDG